MKKLKMQTPDITAENIAKIAELFPQVATEIEGADGVTTRAIDFDLLRQTLSNALVEDDNERYRLDWPGKKASLLKANTPINKTLRPDRESSVNFDTTENVFIEGDNFEVLKVLQESYLGKIKMIYIDPPYNTGKDFVYRDNRMISKEEYEEELGVEDEEGGKLFRNTDTNGRFHSDWLSMMYERLVVARDLLKDDGVIFISIDDHEQANLRKICDEIFGEENFIDCIIWKKRYGGGSKEKYLVSVHEYILFYSKNIDELKDIEIPLSEKSIDRYYIKKDTNFEVRGSYRTHPLEAGRAMEDRKNLIFPIIAPDGTNVVPKRQWLWSKEKVEDALRFGELEFLKTEDGWVVSTKQYLRDRGGEVRKAKAFSLIDDVFTQHGTNEIISIFGDARIFSYPKPVDFLKKLLKIGSEKDSLVLDFFAGSGATAHAIMALNTENKENRKFIMVQMAEETSEDSEAYKAGYKYISDISKERIHRAGKKILEENKEKLAERETPLDIGFRVYKADTTNMKDVYYHPFAIKQGDLLGSVSNIKEDRTPEDLLTQVILDLGLTLDLPVEKKDIKGNAVYFVAGNALVACFDNNIDFSIVDDIAKFEPLKVVFKDVSFREEQDRTNVETRFKRLSSDTIITVL